MIVTVLGASGQTGQEVVKQALEGGHKVHALVRRPDSLESRSGLEVFVGNVTHAPDVVDASRGTDVVISALGTGSGKSSLMSDAIDTVIEASRSTGVKRFILVSSYVVGGAQQLTLGTKLMSHTLLRNIKVDKAASESMLKASDLAWTIVDPTRLHNGASSPSSRIVAPDERIGLGHSMSRAALATWMLQEAEHDDHVRDEVIVSG